MARKNEAHDAVVESLTQALLLMMEQKPLAQINISELCEKAGVSRVSFYRNFDSMEQILLQHFIRCTDDWWADFKKKDSAAMSESFCWSSIEKTNGWCSFCMKTVFPILSRSISLLAARRNLPGTNWRAIPAHCWQAPCTV